MNYAKQWRLRNDAINQAIDDALAAAAEEQPAARRAAAVAAAITKANSVPGPHGVVPLDFPAADVVNDADALRAEMSGFVMRDARADRLRTIQTTTEAEKPEYKSYHPPPWFWILWRVDRDWIKSQGFRLEKIRRHWCVLSPDDADAYDSRVKTAFQRTLRGRAAAAASSKAQHARELYIQSGGTVAPEKIAAKLEWPVDKIRQYLDKPYVEDALAAGRDHAAGD